MGRVGGSFVVLIWICGALPVFAQETARHAPSGTTVLLPPRGDERLPSEREAAQRALSEALAQQGYRVVPHAEALSRLPADAVACDAVDCAPVLLRTLGMQLAAACAVWLSPDAPEGTVFVTLVDDAGTRYPGAHPVSRGNLAVATRAALAEARGLQLLGPGPWLRVHGQPDGARVFLDGELVGALPYRSSVTSGRHELTVRAPGYRSEHQTLDIPLNVGRIVDVEVTLEPGEDPPEAARVHEVDADHQASAPAAALTARDGERVAQAGDYLLGGALVVGGVLLMTIDPVPAALLHGDTVPGRPDRRYSFGPRAALEVIGGAALIATGAIVVFVWKPFALRVSTGSQTSVQLSTRF